MKKYIIFAASTILFSILSMEAVFANPDKDKCKIEEASSTKILELSNDCPNIYIKNTSPELIPALVEPQPIYTNRLVDNFKAQKILEERKNQEKMLQKWNKEYQEEYLKSLKIDLKTSNPATMYPPIYPNADKLNSSSSLIERFKNNPKIKDILKKIRSNNINQKSIQHIKLSPNLSPKQIDIKTINKMMKSYPVDLQKPRQ